MAANSLKLYKAEVALGKNQRFNEAKTYYVPAETLAQAVEILEKGRFKSYEGIPLEVWSIELLEGIYLLPKSL